MNSTLAILVALSLAAPGDTLIRTGGGKLIPTIDDGWATPLMVIPFDKTGPLITEDANTVTHVYWNGSALVDTKGNSWTMNGTVPQNVASPFVPATKVGAGPFTDANNYSLGSGSDVLDFTGDFSACVAYQETSSEVPNIVIVSDGNNASNAGWYVQHYNLGNLNRCTFGVRGNGSWTFVPAQTSAAFLAPTICCFGVNGGTAYVKANNQAIQSGAVALPRVAGTAQIAYLGRYDTVGLSWPRPIYEFWASSTPASDALFTSIISSFWGQVAYARTAPTTPISLTMTRSSVATYEQPAGTLWTAPAGVLRVNQYGALIEASATNYALNSATHPKTNEASASVTTGAAVAWHAGGGTLTITAGTATLAGLTNCTTTPVGTPCTFTVNVAGTVLITTTAGATRVQIEKGSNPTSYIATAGTSGVRQRDQVTAANPQPSNGTLCVDAVVSPYTTWAKVAANSYVCDFGTTNTNRIALAIFALGYMGADTAGATSCTTPGTAFQGVGTTSYRLGVASPGPYLWVNGTSVAGPFGCGPNTVGTLETPWQIGTLRGLGTELNGYVRSMRLFDKGCNKAKP